MNTEELNTALCEKMLVEQGRFVDQLKAQTRRKS